MIRRLFTLVLLLLLLFTGASAQDLRIQAGVTLGASRLMHNTRFETTELHDLYKTVELTHRPESYAWEDFAEDFGLRQAYIMPRAVFTINLSYRDLPLFALGELGTSSSSYQKPFYAVTLGVGKDFTDDWGDAFFSAYGGFKLMIRDAGFGAETLVNSIGNDEARSYIETYFAPERPLGQQSGRLLTVRGGGGFFLNDTHTSSIGVEVYGELDTTNETARQARMNTLGVHAYVRFNLFKPAEEDIQRGY
jgi:hypothetical protein